MAKCFSQDRSSELLFIKMAYIQHNPLLIVQKVADLPRILSGLYRLFLPDKVDLQHKIPV